MTQSAHQIAAGLSDAQKQRLDLLAFTCGRLTVTAFEDLPSALIDARPEGGLFRQAYISSLGNEVRAILMGEGDGERK